VSNANRKLFTIGKRKQYKKHHRVKGILVGANTHPEYLKIVYKSFDKDI
jgi:hypothetical protein